MGNLIREERYVFQLGTEEHILRVEELIRGVERWPDRCRIRLAASHRRKAKTFYSATPREVVELATEYLSSST